LSDNREESDKRNKKATFSCRQTQQKSVLLLQKDAFLD